MIPDRLQYFLEHFWNDQKCDKLWTLGPHIYHKNISKDTRKMGHPWQILCFRSECSVRMTRIELGMSTMRYAPKRSRLSRWRPLMRQPLNSLGCAPFREWMSRVKRTPFLRYRDREASNLVTGVVCFWQRPTCVGIWSFTVSLSAPLRLMHECSYNRDRISILVCSTSLLGASSFSGLGNS